jgi:hypothetical protein
MEYGLRRVSYRKHRDLAGTMKQLALLVLVAACGSNPMAPIDGSATVLIYNPSNEVAHVTARPGIGSDFDAVTLGDVPVRSGVCFIVAAGPAILLEALVGSLNVRSNTERLTPDVRYWWIIGDPDIVPEGPDCATRDARP